MPQTNRYVYEKELPAPVFDRYLPTKWDNCRIVHTEDVGWSALLEFNCEGQIAAPDGTHWSIAAIFRLNGSPYLGREFTEATTPWEFLPWEGGAR